jgi:DNA-binding HxlR family transcriptional regulator
MRKQRRRGYGQFCPLAKAAEILSERWTLLVVRELLHGSRRFSELRRGIPLISPGMLAQRLRELEEAQVITRRTPDVAGDDPRGAAGGSSSEYTLTAAGAALGPVVEQLAVWGHHWALGDLRKQDLDPAYLMWAAHRTVRGEAFGPDRVVVAFEVLDAPAPTRHWWLVVDDHEVDLCLKNPGLAVDLRVLTKVRPLALVVLGLLAPETAIRSGSVALHGAPALARGFSSWWPGPPTRNANTTRLPEATAAQPGS